MNCQYKEFENYAFFKAKKKKENWNVDKSWYAVINTALLAIFRPYRYASKQMILWKQNKRIASIFIIFHSRWTKSNLEGKEEKKNSEKFETPRTCDEQTNKKRMEFANKSSFLLLFCYSPINRSKLSGLTIWISSECDENIDSEREERKKNCFVSINCSGQSIKNE